MGLALVLFINLTADSLQETQIIAPITMVLVETVDATGNPITTIVETPAPPGYLLFREAYLIDPGPFSLVKGLSIIGLGVFGLVGFLAARWVAARGLRPLERISRAAKQIDARSLNQRLDYHGPQDEVKDLADTIDLMLSRLDANFEQQAQYSANLAHELRTPLTALRMKLEALTSDPQASIGDYQEMAASAEQSLTRLERVVENLLLMSREEKELAQQPVFLGVLIEEILDELTPIARERGVDLKASGEADCEVYGDAALLHRAFANLVENGILYNRPGGWVEVHLEKRKDQALIEVRDNGKGIRPEEQEKVFDRFYRGRSRAEEQPDGRGLGLAITRHVIELHHGSISMESAWGKGSTFRAWLPLMKDDENS